MNTRRYLAVVTASDGTVMEVCRVRDTTHTGARRQMRDYLGAEYDTYRVDVMLETSIWEVTR